MREHMTTTVSSGEVLQVHSSRGPIGQPVTVPSGVTSVTIIFRDTESFKAAQAKRAEKRDAARAGRGKKRRVKDED
jgi:hypothetical protein